MMLALVALGALLSVASAQNPCICALMTPTQIGQGGQQEPLPLVREVLSFSTECSQNVADACNVECFNWMQNVTDTDVNQCRDSPSFADRCYGSFWCEILAREGITGEALELRAYANNNCTDFDEWRYTGFEGPNTLCCDADGYSEACRPPGCDCVTGDFTCECGLFADLQFQPPNVRPGEMPLPLKMASRDSANFTEEEKQVECFNFPTNDSLCVQACYAAADLFLADFDLCAEHPKQPLISFGQAYCQALKARSRGNFQGCDDPLTIFGRAPQCPMAIGWDTSTVYGVVPKNLICDGAGNYLGKCPKTQ